MHNEENFRLAERQEITTLPVGSLVKGIQSGFAFFPSLVKDGIRAGEFLGIDNHTDQTPLDTDFAVITSSNTGKTLHDIILQTPARRIF